MTRKFWGSVMATSLLVTAGASYVLLEHVNNTGFVAISSSRGSDTRNSTVADEPMAPSEATAPAQPAEIKTTDVGPPKATRNILFTFPRASAKSVFIIGDFNDWHRQPLDKKGKGWQITLPLEPGTYKYQFVVDEKHVRDPNNKKSADEKSLITVKPLTP